MPKKDCRNSGKLGKSTQDLKRRRGNRDPRKYILIVVEGKETEYNYFTSFNRSLKLPTTKVKVVAGSGGDPLVVVERAGDLWNQTKQESARGNTLNYDEVFCVFDGDQPTKYEEAVKRAKELRISTISSIPCFEVWFLLHYCYTTSPFQNCSQVIERLKKEGLENYQKNQDIYGVLKSRREQAIANAERLSKEQQVSNGAPNPSTQVHLLVKHLQQQKELI